MIHVERRVKDYENERKGALPPLLKVIALIENKSGLIGRTVVHKCIDVWSCFDSAPLSSIGEEWKKKKSTRNIIGSPEL
jgi:hypothetical protein